MGENALAPRLCILGPLRLRGPAGDVALGGTRPRRLLAALALNPNEVASTSLLADAIWGATPPRSARQNLHTYIWSLRRALATAGRLSIEERAPGYVLRVQPDDLDWLYFHRNAALAAQCAASDPVVASRLLHAALGYWPASTGQGNVVADVADGIPALRARIASMEEARMTALEQRIQADLATGRQAGLVAELAGLVAEHPLRERFREQQMLALYRCGRQAEALGAYRDLRATLADELGIDPSPPVRELYQAMLRADPGLATGAVSPRSQLARSVVPLSLRS